MNQQLIERLKKLEEEFQRGQLHLGELEARESDLRSRLLRISGAIQVLRELLDEQGSPKPEPLHALEKTVSTATAA